MERIECLGGVLLVDCYNANPRSTQAAMQTLAELSGGPMGFAVLGDMRELGDSSDELHWQTGRALAESGLGGLCAFGPAARSIARGAKESGLQDICETESVSQAVQWAQDRLRRGAFVLLKGSRAMRMERIALELARVGRVSWSPGHPEDKE
jgi:UDP-N-acetylmuramoyl-tripeptide--D-alanyl-D-alanine ligase